MISECDWISRKRYPTYRRTRACSPTPLRVDKIGPFLKRRLNSNALPIYGGGAADAPLVGRLRVAMNRKDFRGMPIAGEIVTETFDYDDGRQVTVYLPPDPPEAIVFAGDGLCPESRGGLR
jgi:hypothetical protein